MDMFLQNLLDPLFFLKVVFLIVVFIYIIFSFVVFTQVKTMNNVINEIHSSTVLLILAIFNVIAAISLFAYALAIL